MEKSKKYEYFDHRGARDNIYELTKGLTEYIHTNKIQSIIFIDKAARPAWVGVDEYWKHNYPEEAKPDFYFLNPKSLRDMDVTDSDYSQEVNAAIRKLTDFLRSLTQDEETNTKSPAGNFEDKKAEFEATYSRLSQNKDKPVLLFDNCSHSGRTITTVKKLMESLGYQVQYITANYPDNLSGAAEKIDVGTTEFACYPFGSQSGVKNTDNLLSARDDNADRETAALLRTEIRKIIESKELKKHKDI